MILEAREAFAFPEVTLPPPEKRRRYPLFHENLREATRSVCRRVKLLAKALAPNN
ncbi:hypothetical protein ACNKHX_16495 [Shigella flexneri]